MSNSELVLCDICGYLNEYDEKECLKCGELLSENFIHDKLVNNDAKNTMIIERETVLSTYLYFYDQNKDQIKYTLIKSENKWEDPIWKFLGILIYGFVILGLSFILVPNITLDMFLFLIIFGFTIIPLVYIIEKFTISEITIFKELDQNIGNESIGKILSKGGIRNEWNFKTKQGDKLYKIKFSNKYNGKIMNESHEFEFPFSIYNHFDSYVFSEENGIGMKLFQGDLVAQKINNAYYKGCNDFKIEALESINELLLVFFGTTIIIKNTNTTGTFRSNDVFAFE